MRLDEGHRERWGRWPPAGRSVFRRWRHAPANTSAAIRPELPLARTGTGVGAAQRLVIGPRHRRGVVLSTGDHGGGGAGWCAWSTSRRPGRRSPSSRSSHTSHDRGDDGDVVTEASASYHRQRGWALPGHIHLAIRTGGPPAGRGYGADARGHRERRRSSAPGGTSRGVAAEMTCRSAVLAASI